MMQLLKMAKHAPARVFERKAHSSQGVEREIAGMQ